MGCLVFSCGDLVESLMFQIGVLEGIVVYCSMETLVFGTRIQKELV